MIHLLPELRSICGKAKSLLLLCLACLFRNSRWVSDQVHITTNFVFLFFLWDRIDSGSNLPNDVGILTPMYDNN
ncbi:hypothetical protein PLAN_60260 [Planktothrix rubescens CCAP 1459/22]|uniref:Uncharacterized protein n=1 Tax=Planktothrix rubescens CCAP 1459/22 TaxID=329571 RepID=A0A6J7ZQS1_PLARU|nr:hypothetical protein PLAN_60260 [Planktothrix rubescens NIVA-CYA 18]